ncbi:MAG: hypothetical protein L0216_05465 [Planctomycetales bacterium]|nr:hypothetical protein [Planctomycetales bacterium]
MARRTVGFAGIVVVTGAAIAWAATSANFVNDPAEFDQGGGVASSASYVQLGSIGGTLFVTDPTNLIGRTTSTGYINTAGPGETTFGTPTTGVPSFSVAAGASNPGATNESASATNVSMVQFRFTTGAAAGTITVNSITVTASGTGNDGTQVNNVELWNDANTNGVVDGTEAQLGSTGTYSGDNGTVTFSGTPLISLAAGSNTTLLVRESFTGSPTAGSTFQATVAVGGVSAVDSSSNPIVPAGLPVAGGVKTIAGGATPGSLSIAVGPANPGGTSVAPGVVDERWLQFTVTASSVETITVNTVRLTATGTLDDGLEIQQVKLWNDVNSNGLPDDGGASQLSTTQAYSGDNGTLTFGAVGLAVPAGTTVTALVTYTLIPSATGGATAAATIAANADVVGTGATSGATNINPTGAPVGSLRSVNFPPQEVFRTPSSKSGGGCAAMPVGVAVPPGAPLGVLAPWLALAAVLLLRRRRA